MENALRFPHTTATTTATWTDGGFGWRSLGGISNVRKIIDTTHRPTTIPVFYSLSASSYLHNTADLDWRQALSYNNNLLRFLQKGMINNE